MSAALALPVKGQMTADQIRAVLDGWQSRITLKNVGRGHHYVCDGAKKGCASVTTRMGARVSPRLIDWSSRVEREACIETAWRLMRQDAIAMPEDREAFAARFGALAGQERENQKQLREAGELGTEVHALIEWHLKTKLGIAMPEPKVSDRAIAIFGDFERWADSVDLEPIAMEFRLFHRAKNYGGTGDLAAFATLPGKPRRLGIGDYKTSKGIWPEMRIQSGAYRAAWEEMGLPPAFGFLIHLPKEGEGVGTVQVHEVEEPLEDLMAAFDAHSQLHGFYGRYR